ncbi:MAG: hypothetical protein A3E88_06875 [Legionellales bacterium RIFCSPHIGHO2_12_FULL_35_11]|nr:MAG: hypothetical protein A3E88_06875 [Legionellales bacterium RIFCSPHIGHO2_12_FULL_35_11]
MIKEDNIDEIVNYHKNKISQLSVKLKQSRKDDPFISDIKSQIAEHYAQIAHSYYKSNKFTDAFKEYTKALYFNPEHLTVINQLGIIKLKDGSNLSAIDYFQKIIGLVKDERDLHFKVDAMLSLALAILNENHVGAINKANKLIEMAETISPDYSEIYKLKNKIEQQRNFESTIKEIKKSISNDKFNDAEKFINGAKKLYPNNSVVNEEEDRLRLQIFISNSKNKKNNLTLFGSKKDDGVPTQPERNSLT